MVKVGGWREVGKEHTGVWVLYISLKPVALFCMNETDSGTLGSMNLITTQSSAV
jgi:hypothetical protein